MTDSQAYQSGDQLEAIVRGFEDCTMPDSEFSHPAHLVVAFSYLQLYGLTVEEAARRMRAGLYRFLDHHGHDRRKYNETITLFWIKLVRGFLDRTDTSRPLPAIINELLEACGSSQLIYSYYSKERLLSDEARKEWIEPDLMPLTKL